MIRLFVFFAVILAAALGLAWLADRPGDVSIVWQGSMYKMSLMTAIGFLAALVVVLMVGWSILSAIFRLPGLVTSINRMRRRARGMTAVSRGIIAIGAGDLKRAERQAKDAERLLGHEPLTLLLKAQAAQLAGDRAGAETAFRKMLDDPETRILGLRGLFVEARRRSDVNAARLYAEEAWRVAPAVPWAGEAVLEFQSAQKDWRAALATVEQNAARKLIDKGQARRLRAVLLTAEAEGLLDRAPDEAQRLAAEAVKLEPGLVPAAALYGKRLSAKGDYRGSSRVLETAWKLSAHPDIADAYLDVRPGDSGADRMKRARVLQKSQPKERESRFAVARAAMEAQEFAAAREEIEALIVEKPTARACQMMAELEMRDGSRAGPSREWLSRAARAPRDPAWVADGFVSERWLPASPLTGRLDAFIWKEPAQALEANIRATLDADRIIADHDEGPIVIPAPEELPEPAAPEAVPAPPVVSGPASAAPPVKPEAEPMPAPPASAPRAARPTQRPKPAIFPMSHAPDDPGLEAESPASRSS